MNRRLATLAFLLVIAAAAGARAVDPASAGQPGLDYRFVEGSAARSPAAATWSAPATVATGRPLSAEETAKLLGRLPAFPAEAADKETNFAKGTGATPAPPANTKTVDVPASASAPANTRTAPAPLAPPVAPEPPPAVPAPPAVPVPLRVERWSPEGEFTYVDVVTVTFNLPMLASGDDPEHPASVPVKLTPSVAGSWRWVDARTVEFRPSGGKFPSATTFEVEIPAGVRSSGGQALAAAKAFRFETPALKLIETYPPGSPGWGADEWPGRTSVVMVFDQDIDAAAVFPFVQLQVQDRMLPVRLVNERELAALRKKDGKLDDYLKSTPVRADSSRRLVVVPEKPLPLASVVAVTLKPGAPSKEGPNVSTNVSSRYFRTLSALKVYMAEPAYSWEEEEAFEFHFNHTIAPSKFRPSMVQVTPAIAEVETKLRGDTLVLSGSVEPGVLYTVTLSPRIEDIYGQKLGKEVVEKWLAAERDEGTLRLEAPTGMMILPPDARRKLRVNSRGYDRLRVRAWRMDPALYGMQRSPVGNYNSMEWTEPSGPPVFDQTLTVKGSHRGLTETRIDLSRALPPTGLGQLLLVVDPLRKGEAKPDEDEVSRAWVQSTSMAIDAFRDDDTLLALVTDLATGSPVPDADVALLPEGTTARTDAGGLARIPLPELPTTDRASMLLARKGSDASLLPSVPAMWKTSDPWLRKKSPTELGWYTLDDRRLYRPGEKVTLKGWLRHLDLGKDGAPSIPVDIPTVDYRVRDALQTELAHGSASVDSNGEFDLAFEVPASANLGDATVEMVATGGEDRQTHTHKFSIREFRRPEFEVSARVSASSFVVGEEAAFEVAARYLAGGALPAAPVRWAFRSEAAEPQPPGWDDFEFGGNERAYDYVGNETALKSSQAISGTTDSAGRQQVRVDLHGLWPPSPRTLTGTATVTDVNGQAWTATASTIVYPSDVEVGVKVDRYGVDVGEKFRVALIGVRHDGRPVVGRPIEVRLEGEGGRFSSAPIAKQSCKVTSAAEPVWCEFDAKAWGDYRVLATIRDEKGRASESENRVWVWGGPWSSSSAWSDEDEIPLQELELKADRDSYDPGATAHVRIAAPFYPAEVLLTVRCGGFRDVRRLHLDGPVTVPVSFDDKMIPSVQVHAYAVGRTKRDDHDGQRAKDGKAGATRTTRPAHARGAATLKVAATPRRLQVAATPSDPVTAPGASTGFTVVVRDAVGEPVEGARVAVFVVDEAVLALTHATTPDPLPSFHPERADRDYWWQTDFLARKLVKGGGVADGEGGAYGEAASPEELGTTPPPPLKLRADLNPLAAFFPSLLTDGSGSVTAQMKLPDNVTRYRIIAVASSGATRFGTGEGSLEARLPLTVRMSPPRFLDVGDTFELPVVVQNLTASPMDVRVALRVRNLKLDSDTGRDVTVPAGDRVEVRFPGTTASDGAADLQVIAVGAGGEDAASLSLPVRAPVQAEVFATTGVVDDGAVLQPVILPPNPLPAVGGLDVSLSSTNLQSLTDALLYLSTYPHECGEQISSRMAAVAALEDVLDAFHANGLPSKADVEARLKEDVKNLVALQNSDGGFTYWSAAENSNAYLTCHVTNMLLIAKARGIEVPSATFDSAAGYLARIDSAISAEASPPTRSMISSYALLVRKRLGTLDLEKVRRVIADAGGVEHLPVESAARLLSTVADQDVPEREALRRRLDNLVVQEGPTASVTHDRVSDPWVGLYSDLRTSAVVLDALVEADPHSLVLPKLVGGLLARREQARWKNTQENAYALLAIDRYFRVVEKDEPDFVARLWLEKSFIGEHTFRGRSDETADLHLPMADLLAGPHDNLTIQKDGTGRLHYRAAVRSATASGQVLTSADAGFSVTRLYEGADDKTDVQHLADGTWKIRRGTRVRVKLVLQNPTWRWQVALTDPLPAGLEPVEPAILPKPDWAYPRGCYFGPDDDGSWWSHWYNHENLRDDRAEVYSLNLQAGSHSYDYITRATTPGHFVAPPAHAEMMYTPEVHGNSASDMVVVE